MSEAPEIVALPKQLDATCTEHLCAELLERLERTNQITLRAGAVERVSTQAMQVLVAAQLTAKHRGGGITLEEPSEPLTDALSLLGLDQSLTPKENPNG